jgi:hypothetical protein
MRFDYFDSLTPADAENFLREYLSIESRAVEDLRKEVERDGVAADMTLTSIQPVFVWIAERLRTLRRDPDPTLPWWIREAESYRNSLFEFDEPSNVLIMRASFYYGEAFVRYSSTLSWGIGRRDTALKNMPVVTGFSHKLQLPAILIAENLFIDILNDSKGPDAIGQTVEAWRQKMDDPVATNGCVRR